MDKALVVESLQYLLTKASFVTTNQLVQLIRFQTEPLIEVTQDVNIQPFNETMSAPTNNNMDNNS